MITILPNLSTEKDRLRDRARKLKEQGLTHSLKKAPSSGKKRKKDALSKEALTSDVLQDDINSPTPHSNKTADIEISVIQNADTASLTAKVLAEEQVKHKRRKMAKNDNLKSLFSSKNGMDEKHLDFMTRGYSIPTGAKR